MYGLKAAPFKKRFSHILLSSKDATGYSTVRMTFVEVVSFELAASVAVRVNV
jgi:hypothetical protein